MKTGQRLLYAQVVKIVVASLLCLTLSAALVAAPLTVAPSASAVSGPGAGRNTNLTFGEFVGSNSFFDENQACYEVLGNIREYHPWGLTEWTVGSSSDSNWAANNSIISMNPQAVFINQWNMFDSYYKAMRDRGIEVTLVMHGCAYGTWGRPDHQDPDGTRSAVPASYLGHAQSMFQHAARYGSNTNVDPSLVRVAAGTDKLIGLGYVQYYENYNEPYNNDFNGEQYAAMLSADYDGHMGTLGPDVGVKAADPNAKVVFGGSYAGWFGETSNGSFTFDFLADMMAWFDANRTLDQWKAAHGGSEAGYVKYPFDVISAHAYSWDASGNGIPAETYGHYGILKGFVDNCRAIFPDKELYFSEFGWDSSPYSSMHAQTPGNTSYDTQGRWLVRDYLLAAAAGIDRARQFMMPDTSNDRNNPGWFGTCGLINGIQGSSDFKPSWYYIGTMRDVLKDASMNDIEILSDGGWQARGGYIGAENNGPWALKFKSAVKNEQIYALWLPTALGDQGGANTQDYAITVPAGYEYATLVTMQDKVKWGERTDISSRIQNGGLTVSISEKPVFVILGVTPGGGSTDPGVTPPQSTVYTLTFMNGSTVFATKTVTSPASTIDALPADPTNGNYTFGGWYTGANGSGTRVYATTQITSDLTVYAHWIDGAGTGGTGAGGTGTGGIGTGGAGTGGAGTGGTGTGGTGTGSTGTGGTGTGGTGTGGAGTGGTGTGGTGTGSTGTGGTGTGSTGTGGAGTGSTGTGGTGTGSTGTGGTGTGGDNSGVNNSGTAGLPGDLKLNTPANPFADIAESDWFYEHVMYAYARDLMTGISATPMLFAPGAVTTRGMAVTILWRMAGEPNSPLPTSGSPFNDLAAGSYYNNAVQWAAANGVVFGYGNKKFGPNDPISRQDLAVILARYADKMKITLPSAQDYPGFSDDSVAASYAKSAIEKLCKAGIIGGYPDGGFKPRGETTRAEFAAVLTRFMEAKE